MHVTCICLRLLYLRLETCPVGAVLGVRAWVGLPALGALPFRDAPLVLGEQQVSQGSDDGGTWTPSHGDSCAWA